MIAMRLMWTKAQCRVTVPATVPNRRTQGPAVPCSTWPLSASPPATQPLQPGLFLNHNHFLPSAEPPSSINHPLYRISGLH